MELNSSMDVLEALREQNFITDDIYTILLKNMVLNSFENKLALVNELLDHDKLDLPGRKKRLSDRDIPTILNIVNEEFSKINQRDQIDNQSESPQNE